MTKDAKNVFDYSGKKKIWFLISLALIAVIIVVTIIKGVEVAIEFKGGTKDLSDRRFSHSSIAFQRSFRVCCVICSIADVTSIDCSAKESDILFPLADNITIFLLPSDLSFVSFTNPLATISFMILLTEGCEWPISLAMDVIVFASPRDKTKKTGNHLGFKSTPNIL